MADSIDPVFQQQFRGAKLPLKPMHIWGIRARLQVECRWRDLALLDVAIDSKLRGCDLVALRMSDILVGAGVRRRGIIVQQKTGRPVQFEITDQARQSVARWLRQRRAGSQDWLFPSRMNRERHLSARQYARLVKHWVKLIELEPSAYATHSLRRTKVSLLYRKTGNLRACQLLLGHTKLESTVRYLGVELDDALEMSAALEI
jgi:integrase